MRRGRQGPGERIFHQIRQDESRGATRNLPVDRQGVSGSASGSANPTVDGTDAVYGVGGDLYLGKRFGLRVEWERYALDPNDVDFVSASVLFRF